MPVSLDTALGLVDEFIRRDRVAHAYLITGAAGSGKSRLASRFIERLTGKGEDQNPNLIEVSPESKSRSILINQITDLEDRVRLTASSGSKKVAIIRDAERMNGSAANAFLKTLEEPPKDTHILLLTEYPDQLLDTIISRCSEIPLTPPPKATLTEPQIVFLETVEAVAAVTKPSVQEAYTLASKMQSILEELRLAARADVEGTLKKEKAALRDAGVTAAWLDKREESLIGKSEVFLKAVQGDLILVIELLLSAALRAANGVLSENVDPSDPLSRIEIAGARFAGKRSTAELLRRSRHLEPLRSRLSNPGIQPNLAIEVAFMGLLGALPDDRLLS
jgi:DNA polymerase-3 subunit delta'